MRSILVLSLCLLALPVSALAGPDAGQIDLDLPEPRESVVSSEAKM